MAGLALICVLLIALNAFLVLMEFSLVKVRSSRLELLARRGNPRALKVQEMVSNLDDYLAACQVGITVIGLALGWLGEPALAAWIGGHLRRLPWEVPREAAHGLAFALALGTLAWAHIVMGELVPRAVGIQKAEAASLWGALPMRGFAWLFRGPIAVMSASSGAILRLFGLKPAAHPESAFSEEEMRILLGETQEKGTLPLERLFLLENLFDMGKATAGEAMIPRDRIAVLSLKKPWEENLDSIRTRRYSRYPLCEEDLDSVIGMVHLKDLILKGEALSPGGQGPDLKRARRDIAEVLETDSLERLLRSFPDRGIHMAIVRNGLGHVTGLLTLEDIIEEMIGEVHDEFDLPQAWSLMDILVPGAVSIQMQASTPQEAILQMGLILTGAVPGLDGKKVFEAVWERELKFSSAVGRGVAVPHARLQELERPLIALGRFLKPVSFPSPDNVPVRLVFLILTPAATPVLQLKVLGRIASLITNENLRRRLLRVKSAETMLETLRTADTMLAA